MQIWHRMRHIWKQKQECLGTVENRPRCVRGTMNPSIPCSPAKATGDERDVSSVPGRVPMPGEPVRFPASSDTSSSSSSSHTTSSSWTFSYHRPRLWPLLLAATAMALINPGYCQSPNSIKTVTRVCESMDIRNSPRMFDKLRGCRVVEGFLQITLIDSQLEATPAAYQNLSFPELREITGYLMLYRIRGLKTLGDLFPNLAVIRGHTLVRDYALIIYEVMQLEEIGLYSLTDITRGSVRIEKNFILCYVNTIDWDRIAYNGKDGHYFADNKAENECPLCPGYDGGTAPGAITTNLCPVASSTSKDLNAKRHLCWNQNHCQKICSNCPDGVACTASGKCCDKHCLGGCSDDSPSNCTVCRDLYVGELGNHECVSNCPANHYKHRDWRCITAEECRNVPLPKEYLVDEYAQKPFKPINGTCMFKCPPDYYEKIDKNRERSSCEPCNGPCIQECHGLNVDSIQAAQQLQYCTYIKGSLEINVRGGGNIVKELEKGLGMITDIQGSLKVARSYPLLSLDFLKSLKRIHGMNGNKKVETALSVTDNENLQDLWNWTTHGPIEILHGKLFFHFNPKLCYEKIQILQGMTNETTFSELEVARSSNGDKIACNVTLLNITVVNRTKNAVLISWNSFAYEDRRALLGYVIYSTEVANRNVTLYEGRDACGGDGWHVDDIQNTDNSPIYHLMTQLKPYTQYAVYVKTYTIATERLGAQSDIVYIWTLPGQPSPPRITEVSSLNPNSLSLRWLPPEYPNGNVTQYRITIQWEEDSESLLRQRNYCNEPLVHKPEQKKKIIEVEKTKEKDENSDSVCPCDSVNFRKDEDVIREINFEDYLQNHIYKKRVTVDQNRRRRDVEGNIDWDRGSPVEFPSDAGKDQPVPQQDFKTIEEGGFYLRYAAVLGNQTSFNISKLHHFGTQMISLWACREIEEGELNADAKQHKIENCSVRSIIRHRTGMLLGADDISGLNVKIQSNSSVGDVRVIWKEPAHPNSLILTYHIQYRRIDIENHALTTECITRQEFLNKSKSYMIKNLNSGNYSIRVMATSLAGNGNYSEYAYFFIQEKGSNMHVIIITTSLGILVMVLALCLLYRRFMPPPPNIPKTLIADVNPEYMSTVYVPDDWEVPRSDIELIKELGQGSFGMVYEGIAKNLQKANKPSEIRCAVKTVNEHATERERLDFLKEASVMKAFDTPHVVRLLGVVSSGLPSLVIMELMSNGDLKSYLRLHRHDHDKPSLSRILQMAMEIADGMAYLSAKKFVHRDLAARNCMVAGDLKVKVGDFGMTRDIYETDYYRKGTKGFLPVRWMSPESLSDGVFSSSSDIWSYGVVLWEMATLASQPYQGLSNDQVLRYVIDGGVMERPENCPDKLYGLMQLTWKQRPDGRPTFLQLVSMLSSEATQDFREHSFFFSEEGQDLYHQVLPPVVEEVSHSTSPTRIEGSLALDYLEGDSYAPATSHGDTSPQSPYRKIIKYIGKVDKTRGKPHEMEALVGTPMMDMPTIGGGKLSTSPMASTAPNGYVSTWPGNNGNSNIGPTLLVAVDADQQYS